MSGTPIPRPHGLKILCLPAVAMTLVAVTTMPLWGQSYSDARHNLGKAKKAIEENRTTDALKHASTAVELMKKHKPTHHDYISAAYMWANDQDYGPALDSLDKAVEMNPKSGEAWYLRGHIYSKLGNRDGDAQKAFRKALRLKEETQPVNKNWYTDATDGFWQLFAQTGRYNMAVHDFRQLVQVDDNNSRFQYYFGVASFNTGGYEQAVASLEQAIEQKPNDSQFHFYYASAQKKAFTRKEAIARYETLLQKHPVPAVQIWLARFYLEDENLEKGQTLLRQARASTSLDWQLRHHLAKAYFEAEDYEQAADQFARVIKGLPKNLVEGDRINITQDYGKALVHAKKYHQGIKILLEAIAMHQRSQYRNRPPHDILFEVGMAYLKAGRKSRAELSFRQYLLELQEGAADRKRFPNDVTTAEKLGDIYMEDEKFRDYKKAAQAYLQAIKTYEVIHPALQNQVDANLIQFKLVKALNAHGDWDKCIPEAKLLLADKTYGLQARRYLARAYLETKQYAKSLEQLNQLKGTEQWNAEAAKLKGQALLDDNRPQEALKYIEQAYKAEPHNTQLTLLYAQVLKLLNRPSEARTLYNQLLKNNPRSVKALFGLGDLELRLAKNEQGHARLQHSINAEKYYGEARKYSSTPDTQLKAQLQQGRARQERERIEAELQTASTRLLWILATSGVFLLLVGAVTSTRFYYRRRIASQCYKEVCDLESDLLKLIRERVHTQWGGDWARLSAEPFKGRIDYKALSARAQKADASDVLGAATFGNLVAIIDVGWEILGFQQLCKKDVVDPKELIIANLSYVGACRNCLFHMAKLESLGPDQLARHESDNSQLNKGQLSKHLHRLVMTSLRTIRTKFDLRTSAANLPVLTPLSNDGQTGIPSGSIKPMS